MGEHVCASRNTENVWVEAVLQDMSRAQSTEVSLLGTGHLEPVRAQNTSCDASLLKETGKKLPNSFLSKKSHLRKWTSFGVIQSPGSDTFMSTLSGC